MIAKIFSETVKHKWGVYVKIHNYFFILILGFKVYSPNFPRKFWLIWIGLAAEDNTDTNRTSFQMDLVFPGQAGNLCLFSVLWKGWGLGSDLGNVGVWRKEVWMNFYSHNGRTEIYCLLSSEFYFFF